MFPLRVGALRQSNSKSVLNFWSFSWQQRCNNYENGKYSRVIREIASQIKEFWTGESHHCIEIQQVSFRLELSHWKALIKVCIEEFVEFQPWFLKIQLTTVQAKANKGIMQEAQQQHIFLPLSSPSG